ncbi:MAG: sulfotransferase [Elusimicrobia bacterium]|nr:sulfotransferase [Elusimicrobiota bacterium]
MSKKADTPVRARPGRDISRKRRYVYARYNPARLGGRGARDIKNILVINAASRSGSSFLYSLLSRHPDIISLNGEEIVFHKLHGVGAINSAGDSDALPPDFRPGRAVLEDIAGDILKDAGCLYTGRGRFPKENFLADCVQRFILQWPRLQADPDALYSCAAAALEPELRRGHGFDSARFWLSFLAGLAGRGITVNPYYYDMPPEAVRRKFPSVEPPAGPPFDDGCLEETPFIIPGPRTFPGAGGVRVKTLLLKSSSNCYRSGFVKKLFPAARFRFILLARNPMASINGMMDGWLSRGFFSRNLGAIAGLDIKGYRAPAHPWTSAWWKFDLPPGWARYTGKTLGEVCAFQWLSANEHILKDSGLGVFEEKLSVKYEELLSRSSLSRELEKILDFAGLRTCELAGGPAAARPVMAVTAPRPGKWLKRKRRLLPLCSGKVKAAAARLGYDPEEPEKWQ